MIDHDMTAALVPTSTAIMPVLVVAQMRERRELMQALVRDALVKDVDYGLIPGTTKPTLFKSGSEKLCTFFGLSVRLTCEDAQEDWTGEAHAGEAFFAYRYRATILRGDMMVAEAEGSCSSWESKYRYRDSKRACPECGQPAIIKGKEEYGGGWVCFKKQGGCGAKFRAGDAAIEGQQIGRMPNPDVIDQVNTVQKMAQKRAMIAATLIAVNASDFFTQDMEDLAPAHAPAGVDRVTGEIIEGKFTEAPPPPPAKPAAKASAPPPSTERPAPAKPAGKVSEAEGLMMARITSASPADLEEIRAELESTTTPRFVRMSPHVRRVLAEAEALFAEASAPAAPVTPDPEHWRN